MSKKTSNIISISKGANVYFAKANNYYLKNDINKALEYYKRAVVIEPENSINHFNVASLLGEMGKYDESNKILRQTIKMDPQMSECWFYLGINYGQLQKYKKVKYCLQKYLELSPEGEHSEQAKDILAALKNSEYDWEARSYQEIQRIQELCTKGIDLVEKGEFSLAEEVFLEARNINTKVTAPINNLALTYYYQGDLYKAIEESKKALEIDSTNVHALCNIIGFYIEAKDEINLRYMFNILRTIDVEMLNSEETIKLAITYGNLGKHSIAINLLTSVISQEPSNFKAIYFSAIANFNKKKFKSSTAMWKRLNEVEAGNPFSSYYLSLIEKVSKDEKEFVAIPYQIKVPYNSLLEIVKVISDSDLSDDEIDKYREDQSLFDSIVWALNKGDTTLKEPLIDLMISLNDGKYIGAVVDFCYDIRQNYEQRNYAFQQLILANYSFASPELWKGDVFESQNTWSETQKAVLENAIEYMEVKGELTQVYTLQALWNDYVSKTKPIIKSVDIWAKALIGFVVSELSDVARNGKSFDDIDVKQKSIKEKINKIKDVIYSGF